MRPERMLVLAGGMLVVFAIVATVVVLGWTQGLDDAWNQTMTDREASWLVAVAEVFAAFGSFPIAPAVTIGIGLAFLVAKKRWAALTWFTLTAIAQVLSTLSKVAVDRTRPSNGLAVESSASFPSGHSMVAGAAMGIGLALIAGRVWPQRSRLFLTIGVFYAVVMALSRTYLRVHWITDVVGGLAFGTAVAYAIFALSISERALLDEDRTYGGQGNRRDHEPLEGPLQ